MELYDLVEFRFDHQRKTFVKQVTHLTNQPKALCYFKKQVHAQRASLHTRFKVVPNGQLQYRASFK